MKALVLGAFGGPLELKDVPVPAIGPNDVLVKVGACGVGLTVAASQHFDTLTATRASRGTRSLAKSSRWARACARSSRAPA